MTVRLRKSLKRLLTFTAAATLAGSSLLVLSSPATAQEEPTLADECSAPWDADTVYQSGDTANVEGIEYRARWWTQGETPDPEEEWGVWLKTGLCDDEGLQLERCESPWLADTAYERGDVVNLRGTAYRAQWWTEGQKPQSATWDVWEEIGPCQERVNGTYYNYWSDYWPKDLIESGNVEDLTHLYYAFASPGENGECELIGENEDGVSLDHEYMVPAENAVDGVADTPDDKLRGQFGQLEKLKDRYPHLNIVLSVGGANNSDGFATAMEDLESWTQSCYDLVHDPRWDGLFDGIDIDWEFPNLCHPWGNCDESGYDSIRLLMQSLRETFGDDELVTAVGPINPLPDDALEVADWAGAAEYVDYFNLVTFHYEGNWSATTSADAAINSPTDGLDVSTSVDWYLDHDVDPGKLAIAMLPWAVVYDGVDQLEPGGEYEEFNWDMYSAPYSVASQECADTVFDPDAVTSYCWDGYSWWSYDDTTSATAKADWAMDMGLAGVWGWDITNDDASGTLWSAVTDGLYQN